MCNYRKVEVVKPLVSLVEEINSVYNNITEEDQVVLRYLLSHALWELYRDTYDEDYKLPIGV